MENHKEELEKLRNDIKITKDSVAIKDIGIKCTEWIEKMEDETHELIQNEKYIHQLEEPYVKCIRKLSQIEHDI